MPQSTSPDPAASGGTQPQYMIALRLAGALCVVVGGGPVATRKVEALLDCGARVTVISLDATPRLRALADADRIDWNERPYAKGDLAGARLAFAATDDATVNQAVAQEARMAGIWVNVADGSGGGDFLVPATVRRGALTLAVATGGGTPGYTRRLRELLESMIGPEYGEALALYASARPAILAMERKRQPDLWEDLFALDLPARIRSKGLAEAERALAEWRERSGLS